MTNLSKALANHDGGYPDPSLFRLPHDSCSRGCPYRAARNEPEVIGLLRHSPEAGPRFRGSSRQLRLPLCPVLLHLSESGESARCLPSVVAAGQHYCSDACRKRMHQRVPKIEKKSYCFFRQALAGLVPAGQAGSLDRFTVGLERAN